MPSPFPTRILRFLFAILALTLLAPVSANPSQTAVVTGFEWLEDGRHLRIAIDGAPDSEVILLENPHRIVLDLADTVTAARPSADRNGPVSRIRDGLSARDRYRLLFELREPAVPVVTAQTNADGTVIDLVFETASAGAFARAVAERAGRTVTAGAAPLRTDERRFTIVIDPGHGGADYGAVGEGGTLEKELNLSFAEILRDVLQARDEPLDVVLTRDDDTLVPLGERSAIARREGADLFVSIHADSIRHRDLRGATVYTLSLNASDQLAREVAEGENAADRFVGPEWTQDTPEIHDILVDLVKRETEHLSRRFSDQLVVELRRADVRLINNPQRSAGFRVLMAPDVPSVLLEMGYLSNREDEELMSGTDWQAATAEVVADAIGAYLAAR